MRNLLIPLLFVLVVVAAFVVATFPGPRELARRLRLARRAFALAGLVASVAVLYYGVLPVSGAMPIRKGTAWLATAGLPALGAGAAADTSAFTPYWFNPSQVGVYDPEVEYALQLWITFEAVVTGVATNNFAVVVTHYNSAAAIVDQCTLTFANGINASAFVAIDLTTNANVVVNSGAKPGQWLMAPGDNINVKRLSNGTGLASPAFGLGVTFGRKS